MVLIGTVFGPNELANSLDASYISSSHRWQLDRRPLRWLASLKHLKSCKRLWLTKTSVVKGGAVAFIAMIGISTMPQEEFAQVSSVMFGSPMKQSKAASPAHLVPADLVNLLHYTEICFGNAI